MVAVLPVLGFCFLYGLRTVFEERRLADGLEGYRDYTQRVRYRLLLRLPDGSGPEVLEAAVSTVGAAIERPGSVALRPEWMRGL